MRFRCPDSISGICTETRCGCYLIHPRVSSRDKNGEPRYTAACVFDGTLRYYDDLLPEAEHETSATDGEHKGTTTILKAIKGSKKEIIKEIRGENGDAVDKRKPDERRLIDKAIELFIYRRDIEGLKQPESACYSKVWKDNNGKELFPTLKQFDNAVRYDKKCFYNLDCIRAKVKAKPPC